MAEPARNRELLLLVRHAATEQTSPHGDAARDLTAEGQAAFRAQAAEIARRTDLARVVSSPYLRARRTAEILAEACGGLVVEARDALAADASGDDVAEVAEEVGPGGAVVGHNPSITEAAELLLGPAVGARLPFRPGTVAALARDGDGWRLVWVADA